MSESHILDYIRGFILLALAFIAYKAANDLGKSKKKKK